ncbi:hypothetical protein MRX96_009259 [Rhipicephalus microplus]
MLRHRRICCQGTAVDPSEDNVSSAWLAAAAVASLFASTASELWRIIENKDGAEARSQGAPRRLRRRRRTAITTRQGSSSVGQAATQPTEGGGRRVRLSPEARIEEGREGRGLLQLSAEKERRGSRIRRGSGCFRALERSGKQKN